jgi:hypothetical protein
MAQVINYLKFDRLSARPSVLTSERAALNTSA